MLISKCKPLDPGAGRWQGAAQKIYGAALVLLLILSEVFSSNIQSTLPTFSHLARLALTGGAVVLLGVKIFFLTDYEARWQPILAALVLAYTAFATWYGDDVWFFLAALVGLGAKDIDLKAALRVYLAAAVAGLLAVQLLHFVTQLMPYNFYCRNWDFGYGHYNGFGARLAGVAFAWGWLRHDRMRAPDWMGLAALAIFTYKVPGSRGAFGGMAVMLGLFLVRLAVEKTEPSYPEALGNTLDVEKITGTCLVKEAAELPDTLTIFGSSELKTFEIPTHPANFFAGKRAGFQVNLVGRGSCQSLVHAMAIGASEDSLKGKKIVLITAPQSYVEGGIAPDLFLANFSEQQLLALLGDEELPESTQQYVASRVQSLIAQYNAQNGTNLQTHTAAGLLSKAWAADSTISKALLAPYAGISQWLLATKQTRQSPGRSTGRRRKRLRRRLLCRRRQTTTIPCSTATIRPTSGIGFRRWQGATRTFPTMFRPSTTICGACLKSAKQKTFRRCSFMCR